MVTSNYSVPSPVKATPYSNSTYLDHNYTDDVYTFAGFPCGSRKKTVTMDTS